ncbi:hypothetical protein [uncultured Polaribacter sp.]|uniref:hypothetical protein n=1 Tax=uncultured Polaribacter sp. TaxID=174711 RepID=UPI002778D170|nr:hypothetical protein [Polaribacter sp.]|tara:strand:- start:1199 stop:1615 length:417 start_codon:yes stop_codon:yes gene_type:complete
MKATNNYQSFNDRKSIEELQYNMLQNKTKIEEEIIEYKFYQNLIKASIYNTSVTNLLETLENYKQEMKLIENEAFELLVEINVHSNSISNKIECDDLFCDNYFIKSHDDLDEKIHDYFMKCTSFKNKLFHYLESVLKI